MSLLLIGAHSKKNEITGQSLNFDLLLENLTDDGFKFSVISINFSDKNIFKKCIAYIMAVATLIGRLTINLKIKVVYLTVAQSLSGFIRDFFFIWLSSIFGRQTIIHLHGGNYKNFYLGQSPSIQKIIQRTLERCDCIIVLSETYIDLFDFVDNYKSKVRVVKNGIIVNHISPIIKSYDVQKPVLIYLSNLIETKGYIDVLKSIKILKEQYSIEPTIYFCGNFMPSDDDSIFKSKKIAQDFFFSYINENKLEKNVFYKGLVKEPLKSQLLEESNFMLLPTNYNAEGQPISLIEGMAHGCVLITTPYRDIINMNIDGQTGFHVPYQDPSAIANKISNMDLYSFQKMSLMSYQHFVDKYSYETRFNTLKNIFNEFLQK